MARFGRLARGVVVGRAEERLLVGQRCAHAEVVAGHAVVGARGGEQAKALVVAREQVTAAARADHPIITLELEHIGRALIAAAPAGLGPGAHADSRVRDARHADPGCDIDAWLADGLVQRGQAANRLAIASSVIAGVALVAGATLLIVGKSRGGARPVPARAARLDLTRGGLGLRF